MTSKIKLVNDGKDYASKCAMIWHLQFAVVALLERANISKNNQNSI